MDRIWGSFMNDIKEDMRQQTGNSLDTIAEIDTDAPAEAAAATSNKTQKRRKRRQRKQMAAQSSSASSWQSDLPADWQNVITLWMVWKIILICLIILEKNAVKRTTVNIHYAVQKKHARQDKKNEILIKKNLLKLTCGLFPKFKPAKITNMPIFLKNSLLQINISVFKIYKNSRCWFQCTVHKCEIQSDFTQLSHARGDIYAIGGRQVAAGTATTSDERAFCSHFVLSRCALSPIYRCAICSSRLMCTCWKGFARDSLQKVRFLSILSEIF